MIDYFDFIKKYPDIIDSESFSFINEEIIDFVETLNIYSGPNKDVIILKIDYNKLTDRILFDKLNKLDTLLTKNITVGINKNSIFCITQNDGLTIYSQNNKSERIGKFHISKNSHMNYRYPNDMEKKCIKRILLIDTIL